MPDRSVRDWPGHIGITENLSGATTQHWKTKPVVRLQVSGQSLDRQNPGAGEASITREVQLATPPDSARCRPQGKLDAR